MAAGTKSLSPQALRASLWPPRLLLCVGAHWRYQVSDHHMGPCPILLNWLDTERHTGALCWHYVLWLSLKHSVLMKDLPLVALGLRSWTGAAMGQLLSPAPSGSRVPHPCQPRCSQRDPGSRSGCTEQFCHFPLTAVPTPGGPRVENQNSATSPCGEPGDGSWGPAARCSGAAAFWCVPGTAGSAAGASHPPGTGIARPAPSGGLRIEPRPAVRIPRGRGAGGRDASRAMPRRAGPGAAGPGLAGLRAAAVLLCAALGPACPQPFPFRDPTLPWSRRLDDLLGRLSPAEMVLQVRGGGCGPGTPPGPPAQQRRWPAGGEGGSDGERPRAPHPAAGNRALQLEHRMPAGRCGGSWLGHGFSPGAGACCCLQVPALAPHRVRETDPHIP